MAQTELQSQFEMAQRKKPNELTLSDCMVIARCGGALKDDPYLEAWTYGGEHFDLQIFGDYPEDADEIDENGDQLPPETVTLIVFGLDSDDGTDYDKPIHQWTVDYNQTEEWR